MKPKFSILLPTRDRLEYLLQAIETVRRQDFADWEIVISDNASEQDVLGATESIGDPRIRAWRQPRGVPVTENWNAALAASSGQWVVMLGDDDGLLPGALTRASQVIADLDPDALYVGAWSLVYRGAVPSQPDGGVRPYVSPLLASDRPFILPRLRARDLVRRAARFEMPVTFNMQHTWVRRDLVERLSTTGPFFRSPYPDFYATNAVLATAERVAVCPDRLVAIGVTPKSFGSLYFSGREPEGMTFLGNDGLGSGAGQVDRAIPGSPDRTSWLRAMEALVTGPVPELRIDYSRYRRLVLLSAFGGGARAVTDPELRRTIVRLLPGVERWFLVPSIRLGAWLMRRVPEGVGSSARRLLHRLLVRSPSLDAAPLTTYQDMLELFARPPSSTNAAQRPR